MNLAAIFDRHPESSVAVISRGRTTTYGELGELVGHLRGGLLANGLAPGDRVAIVCGNNTYFVAAYLAVIGAGMIAVPLNPLSPPVEIVGQLTAVTAKAVVVGPTARSMFEELERSLIPSVEFVIGCGYEPDGGMSFAELAETPAQPIAERDDTDVAVLIFTSGTAGSPKAAKLTHGNLRSNIAQVLSVPNNDYSSADVSFAVLPMFHIFGLNVVLGVSLATGAKVLLVERFDPISAFEAIEKHDVSVLVGPPTMWAALASMPDLPKDLLSSIRLAVSGAARLGEETAKLLHARFGVELREGYGLTEGAPVVAASIGTDAPVGSIGVPVPGLEVRLVDDSGDDVLIGDPGELWVRGPNVFAGYWNDQAATDDVIDRDGWLHTGDVATVDDEGFLYLVDRRKDLIIVSGFNVYPAEVEEVLMTHPAIEACAVVGVPHPYTGEAVKAYVVAANGISIEEDEVVAFCAERLARYKCPDKVWFVDEVPMGMGGKVLRRAFR